VDHETEDQRPPAVRATGSPDPDDPAERLDPRHDPADPMAGSGHDAQRAGDAEIRNADPGPEMVGEASEDSFPASDPPTWTSSSSTPRPPADEDQSPS
jgi:hypothetical protein